MSVEESETHVTLIDTKDPTTRVEILKFGANIISWKIHGVEQLWLSEAAKLDGTKAVRGGIPLVFPVFGKCADESHPTFNLPQHGFARNSTWEFLGKTSESPTTVQFGLGPENVDPELYKKWGQGSYDFTLLLTIALDSNKLTTSIDVVNTGREAFEFNWLFHTYYKIPDITEAMVSNLVDQNVHDKIIKSRYQEKSPVIQFHGELDRVYEDVSESKLIQIIHQGKVLFNLERSGLPDAVVWNPWIEKSKGMGDFEPKDGYQNMVCVEPGYVSKFVKLEPSKQWNATQTMYTGGEIKIQSNIFQ
mgnify:CR=1 FL=1